MALKAFHCRARGGSSQFRSHQDQMQRHAARGADGQWQRAQFASRKCWGNQLLR